MILEKGFLNFDGELSIVGTQNFPNYYYPLIRTRTCVYEGVRNVSSSEKFGVRTKWMIPYLKLNSFDFLLSFEPSRYDESKSNIE